MNEWLAPSFTIAGVVIGSAGTVFTGWLNGRRASKDKKTELDNTRLENTRAGVLEEIRKYINAADSWIDGLTDYTTAVTQSVAARQEQTLHDDDVREARANPVGWDLGELNAHTATVDDAAMSADERALQTISALNQLTKSLRLASPPCEIVAPTSVASCVEKFTAEAIKTDEAISGTHWIDLADEGGYKSSEEFNVIRSEITAATRSWNHPEQ